MSFSLELTTKNFSEATKINGNDEFCFIVEDQKVYCHKFVAAFISPYVCKMLTSDPTINSFHIQTTSNQLYNKSQESEQNLFNQKIINYLTQLIRGERIEITEKDIKELKSELDQIFNKLSDTEIKNTKIFKFITFIEKLGNDELRSQIYSQFLKSLIKEINQNSNKNDQENNIEQKLKLLLKLESIEKLFQFQFKKDVNEGELRTREDNFLKDYFQQGYEELINEIASHFHEIDSNVLKSVNTEIFEDILKSSSLLIQSEDSLLDILIQRYKNQNDEISENLFHYVRFEYLSEQGIKKFISNVNLIEINTKTWKSLQKRLVLPVENKSKNDREIEKHEEVFLFSCDGKNEFNGIFKYLTTLSNGNIHQNKTIEITSSGIASGQIENIVDFNSDTAIRINENPSPRWIKFDFKNRKVSLNSYLIRSRDCWSNRFIKSWKIEISNNDKDWKMIDEQNNVSELNGDNKIKLFTIKNTEKFSFIRIITDKENFSNNVGFSIGKIELFGKIFEKTNE